MEHEKSGVVMGIVSSPEAEAEKLAGGLVREKLAACAQVNRGITSYFRWEGKVQKENEVLIFFKTTEGRIDKTVAFIEENHSYEVPECLFFSAAGGVPSYIEWVRSESLPQGR